MKVIVMTSVQGWLKAHLEEQPLDGRWVSTPRHSLACPTYWSSTETDTEAKLMLSASASECSNSFTLHSWNFTIPESWNKAMFRFDQRLANQHYNWRKPSSVSRKFVFTHGKTTLIQLISVCISFIAFIAYKMNTIILCVLYLSQVQEASYTNIRQL